MEHFGFVFLNPLKVLFFHCYVARPKLSSLSWVFDMLKHDREIPVRTHTVKLFFAWLGLSAS